jgi:hypothetical protein
MTAHNWGKRRAETLEKLVHLAATSSNEGSCCEKVVLIMKAAFLMVWWVPWDEIIL